MNEEKATDRLNCKVGIVAGEILADYPKTVGFVVGLGLFIAYCFIFGATAVPETDVADPMRKWAIPVLVGYGCLVACFGVITFVRRRN